MATKNITTESETKEWVLACTEFEQCEIESLKNDVSFIESPLEPPTDPKETNSMYFLKNTPRDFIGNGTDRLWIFIDNKSKVRKRSIINKTISTITDAAGRSNSIGVFGEQWATDIKNDILAQFSYGKSNRDLKNENIIGTGTVTIQNDNLLTASTGIDIDGSAEIESFNSIRYRPGHTAMAQFTAVFTNPLADNTHQWIGVADGIDGFAFGFENGIFSVTRMRKGVHTHITELNGSINIADIDFTKINLFRIVYGYLGIAPVSFEIMPKDKNAFVPIHTIRLQGKIAQTHIQLPYLPIKMSVENEGNNTDVQIRTGSWQGGSFGFCVDCGNRPFHYPLVPGSAIKADIPTAMTPIAAFRNKTNFQGFLNKIRAKLLLFNALAFNGEGLVTVQFIANATIDGVEGTDYNFTDIDSQNSVMEISTDLVGFTGGQAGLTLYSFPTTSGSKINYTPTDIDAEALGLFLDPDNIYIIAANISVGTTNIAWSVNWTEMF